MNAKWDTVMCWHVAVPSKRMGPSKLLPVLLEGGRWELWSFFLYLFMVIGSTQLPHCVRIKYGQQIDRGIQQTKARAQWDQVLINVVKVVKVL